MRRHFWVAALLAVSVAAGVACGAGDDRPSPVADRAAAEKAVVKANDLPSGWNARPHEKLPGEDELARDIAMCVGVSPVSERATAEVRSQDFTQALATVSSVITFVKSESEAAADAKAFTSDKFAGCIEPGYKKQIHEVAPEGNTVSNVNVERIDFPAYGDRSAAHRVTATVHISGPGVTVPINIDVIRIFKGRAEVEIVVVAPGSPFPPEFETKLAGAVVARL